MSDGRDALHATDAYGRTPLHVAHVWVVATLLRAKADPNRQDHEGWTPLHHYCYTSPKSISVCLQTTQDLSISMPTVAGLTPLQVLRYRGGVLPDGERTCIAPYRRKGDNRRDQQELQIDVDAADPDRLTVVRFVPVGAVMLAHLTPIMEAYMTRRRVIEPQVVELVRGAAFVHALPGTEAAHAGGLPKPLVALIMAYACWT